MDLFARLVDQYDQLKYALLDAQTFHPDHFGFPPIYYQIMESDDTRIKAFQQAFAAYDFKDKVICEAGVGRLALSQFYLPQVKKAYLIENNPALHSFIQNWIKERGWQHKVELIFEDARTVSLPEPVDAIIGEMMSIFAINEHQVPVFQQLRKFLQPGGRLFPEKIINIAQLAYAEFDHEHTHYPINFTRHFPQQLSLPEIINTIDLYQIQDSQMANSVKFTPTLSGKVNAVFLRSQVQISEGHNFTGTDSLMPPTVCRLEKECWVSAGETISLQSQFTFGTRLEEARFSLT